MWPFLLYLAVAAITLAALRRTRFAPSAAGAAALVLLGLLHPLSVHLRDRQLSELDYYLSFEPWATTAKESGLQTHSSGITSDLATAFTPWAAEIREAWRAGVIPAWTSSHHGGTVLIGAAQAAPFYPDQILSQACSFQESFALVFSMRLFVAALGACLLARQVGLSESAALIAAACWTFSGFHFFWLGWSLGAAAGLFPLVLFAFRELLLQPRRQSLLLVAGVLSLLALAGHPETLLQTVILAAAFVFSELFSKPRTQVFRFLGLAAASGVLAAAIAAAFLLPVADSLVQTQIWARRQALAGAVHKPAGSRDSLASLSTSFVPFAHGIWGKELSSVKAPSEPFSNAYIGSAGLALAAVGLLAGASQPDRRRFIALAFLGLAAGAQWGPINGLVRHVPLLNLALNSRLYFAAALAISMLAAHGFERISTASRARAATEPERWGFAKLALSAVVASLLVAIASWGHLKESGLSSTFLTHQWLLFLVPLIALAPLQRFARRRTVVALLLVLLVSAQRLAEAGHYHAGTENTVADRILHPQFRDLIEDQGPYRFTAQGRMLIPNSAAFFDLDDVRGYDPMVLARYAETFGIWSRQLPVWFNAVEDLSSPFLDFLAVRWALTDSPDDLPAGWEVQGAGPGWNLLQNHEALPLAFLPTKLRITSDTSTVLRQMRKATDFRQMAWLEFPASMPGIVESRDFPNSRGTVEIAEEAPGRYSISADLDREGWIATSIPAWRGWQAEAGGRDLAIAIVNHAFVAIRSPAGPVSIDLHFLPLSLRAGLALSGLGLLIFLYLAVSLRRSGDQAARSPERSGQA